MRYVRLCRLLVEHDMHMICCTISMFDTVREWNRSNIRNYSEIYIEVSLSVLEERNQKNLYQDVKDGKQGNVVGVDLELELPENPDIRLVNDGTRTPEEMGRVLVEAFAGMMEGQGEMS